VTLGDGVFPVTALAEGKQATARALVRTASGEPPPAGVRPAELDGALASYAQLRAAPQARLAARAPDVTFRLRLTGGMGRYDWGINGQAFDMARPGPRKDTVIVRPGEQVACDFDAANPGQWMTHCHNLYHAPGNGGMMALLGYQS
jgi:FtsP/CotA-like multicopper oxidase with cupredoxin domain